jgi:glycerol-3-phosphate acyltransferase PlsY
VDPNLQWSLLALLAYLLGSIPFGLLIGLARGVDIRQHGSKNIGATNAGRVLGRPWGFLSFFLDFLKGAVPVLGSGWWMEVLGDRELTPGNAWLWLGVGIAAVMGHMFPVWLRFKGGKGVATGFGVMLATYTGVTVPAAIALVVWIALVKTWRMVSVASCAAALSLPVSVAALRALGWPSGGASWDGAMPYLIVTSALAALVVWKHRANLARVRAGTESKIGGGKAPSRT